MRSKAKQKNADLDNSAFTLCRTVMDQHGSEKGVTETEGATEVRRHLRMDKNTEEDAGFTCSEHGLEKGLPQLGSEPGRTELRTAAAMVASGLKRRRAGPQGTLQAVVYSRHQNRKVMNTHTHTHVYIH